MGQIGRKPFVSGGLTGLRRVAKNEKELKPESFQALLRWLGPDDHNSGLAYEQVRQRLIRLFTCRGCSVPEELTDDTIDRVINNLEKLQFRYQGDPALYFFGVARNVYFEWLRRERRYVMESVEEKTVDEYRESTARSIQVERQHACLEKCLQKLPAEKRTLLLQYYRYESGGKIDQRKVLAEESGLGLNAMRIQIYRLRGWVSECINKCLEAGETDLLNNHEIG